MEESSSHKKRSPAAQRILDSRLNLDVYPSMMAAAPHTDAQAPQSMQVFGSIEYGDPSDIASTGHSLIQAPHATHASVIS